MLDYDDWPYIIEFTKNNSRKLGGVQNAVRNSVLYKNAVRNSVPCVEYIFILRSSALQKVETIPTFKFIPALPINSFFTSDRWLVLDGDVVFLAPSSLCFIDGIWCQLATYANNSVQE